MKPIIFTAKEQNRIMARLTYLFKSLDPKKKYCIEIKEYREKRSLDANAYMWVLLDQLAEVIEIKKEDLYSDFIRNMGGVSDKFCCTPPAAEKLKQVWEHKGIGYQAEIEDSKLDGMKNITLYYGSSSFDTKQMSRLINLVVQDCHNLDIETDTPDEIARKITEWGE